MAVSNVERRSPLYVGNGVTTEFPYGFKVFAAADLEVRRISAAGTTTILTLTTDYSVSGVGADAGGAVTLTSPLPTGESLILLGRQAFDQPLVLVNQGPYFAEDVMRALDRATILAQQLNERLSRAVVLPPQSDVSGLDALIEGIQILGGIASEIATVAGISANVTTVAGNSANVTTVAGIDTAVSALAAIEAVLVNLNAIRLSIVDVDANEANINTVAGIASNVTTVAGISANVTTVAGISANVTAVANIAPAVTHTAQKYQGAAATDPAVRALDGSALEVGDFYLNTGADTLRFVTSTGPVAWATLDVLVEVATQAEAEAATDNTKIMTPLRARQGLVAARAIGRDVQAWLNGVVADGVTDNQAALQAIVDGLGAAGGGTIHLPAGSVLFTSAASGRCVSVPSNIRIKGQGKQITTLLRGAGVLAHLVDFGTSQYSGLYDMTVDGNKAAETQGILNGYHCIRGVGVGWIELSSLRVANAIYYGIGLQGAAALEESVRITDCDIIACGGWSNEGATFGDNLDIKASRRVWITNTRSSFSAQKGFDIRSRDLFMSGCLASDNSADNFALRGRGDLPTDVPPVMRIANCHAESSANGSGFAMGQDSLVTRGNITITGCFSVGNSNDGFTLTDNSMNMSVSASQTFNNGRSGFRSLADGTSYSACHAEDNGSYGFESAGLARRQVIVGNTARGNPTANIRPNGSAIIANNITT